MGWIKCPSCWANTAVEGEQIGILKGTAAAVCTSDLKSYNQLQIIIKICLESAHLTTCIKSISQNDIWQRSLYQTRMLQGKSWSGLVTSSRVLTILALELSLGLWIINIIGVHFCVIFLRLLRMLLPILTLPWWQELPFLADILGEICLLLVKAIQG